MIVLAFWDCAAGTAPRQPAGRRRRLLTARTTEAIAFRVVSWAECKNYIEGIVGYLPIPYKDQELAFGKRCATFFLFPVSNPSWLSDLGEV